MTEERKPLWYAVNVYSGFEQKVVEAIQENAVREGLEDMILSTLVPRETVVEFKRGKKISSERQFYPGYVLVQAVLTENVWHCIRKVPKVSGFVGGNMPSPMSQQDVDRVLGLVEDRKGKVSSTIVFEIGERVEVCDGPFSTFSGIVEDIDMEKNRMKVLIPILGRETSLDLDFSQVKKV